MSEFSMPRGTDRKLAEAEQERAAHEAEVRREDAGAAAPLEAPAAGAAAYQPAATEQARREQAEVDTLLLGRTAGPSAPLAGTDAARPTFAGTDAAVFAAPDPAMRVPFADEHPQREAAPSPAPHRRSWGVTALAGTAASAALLASLGTAAFTGALEPAPLGPAAGAVPTQVVPASSTSSSPDWQAVTAAVGDSVVAIDVVTGQGQGSGSGVVLDTDGNILTNSHVVAGARELTVTLADGRLHEARLVGQDETTDLAVIRLLDPPADLAPATLGTSADLAVGEAVLAVGNPLGLDSTATTGIVSALDRPVVTQSRTESVVTNAIQVDAAVNPGNSGGPLFDAGGEVIGITSSIATLSGGGQPSGSIGLGFAIPIDQAADVASQLIEHGEAEHAFLGVALSDARAEVDGVTRAGARVESVEPGSPAAEAGLEPGDVITAVDGRPVDGAAALTGYVRQYAAGEEAVLDVVRDGALREVSATLVTRGVSA